ncbi:MAG: DUF4330 family protein [Bacillota bacterium]|nr:DUF4330 family protein [Bacillota bacterium]
MENVVKRKFNVFDILIIIVLVAAIGAVLFVVQHANAKVNTYKVDFEIEVNDVDAAIKDCATVGDSIKNAVQQTDLGVIKSVQVSPYKKELTNYNSGQKVMSEVPGKYSVTLRCTSDKATLQNGRITINGTVMGVGSQIFFQSKDFAGSGIITVVNPDNAGTNKGV